MTAITVNDIDIKVLSQVRQSAREFAETRLDPHFVKFESSSVNFQLAKLAESDVLSFEERDLDGLEVTFRNIFLENRGLGARLPNVELSFWGIPFVNNEEEIFPSAFKSSELINILSDERKNRLSYQSRRVRETLIDLVEEHSVDGYLSERYADQIIRAVYNILFIQEGISFQKTLIDRQLRYFRRLKSRNVNTNYLWTEFPIFSKMRAHLDLISTRKKNQEGNDFLIILSPPSSEGTHISHNENSTNIRCFKAA